MIGNQLRVVGTLWLLVGVLLILDLRRDRNESLEFDESLSHWDTKTSALPKTYIMGLTFATSCIVGALAVLRKRAWGRLIVLGDSFLIILYGVAYLLFHGPEDTSRAYAGIVGALVLLSAYSVFLLGFKGRTRSYFAT
jgi:uncharacterized membrane protein HdeD (DUF308 family)